ncbi:MULTISPECIES: hypothetical protein [Vagococcus]|uniref:hypothetical protein n=1 Tax=Vagococcus TaxID=2737 RepID=UPI002FCAFE58
MSSIIDELTSLLKKKKTIALLISLVIAIILMNVLIKVFRDDIREQQIVSVGDVVYVNKQFIPIKESEIAKITKNKELTVLALVETADNKGLKKVEKMFDSKTPIEGLPKQVYVYEPVYDSAQIKKELSIKDKNTFIVIEDGKEIDRVSFNDLAIGYEEIVDEIDTIVNPKINRKNPVRVATEDTVNEELNQEAADNQGTHTSEVTFE